MKLTGYIFFLLTCLTEYSYAQIQCAVDVTINEGVSIEMCADSPLSISASNGFVAYSWSGPETLSGQTITPQFSGQYIVAVEDGVGCISKDTIQVTINPNPTPTIVSSEGNPICENPGATTLSLTDVYSTYDWGGGNNSPTFFAPTIGTYSITVTDENGCSGQNSISITAFSFDLTQAPVSSCYGTSVSLVASGGTSYLWTTGATTDSIVVNPSTVTNYGVTISNGTCSEFFSETVQPITLLEYNLVDTLYLSPNDQETIEGPPGFESYNWFPSDQIFNPSIQNITFSGTESQIITMEATHSSGCIYSESVVIIIVEATIPNGFSPNGDSYNDFFVIPELEYTDGKIQIWNRWGDVVLDEEVYKNDWKGTCRTQLCLGNAELPEGTYFYHLTIHGIDFDGYITLKR